MADKIDAEISRLLGVVDIVSIASGDFLFRAGDEANGFYIVRHGELEIRNDDLVYETISVGDIVGKCPSSMNQRAAHRFSQGPVPN